MFKLFRKEEKKEDKIDQFIVKRNEDILLAIQAINNELKNIDKLDLSKIKQPELAKFQESVNKIKSQLGKIYVYKLEIKTITENAQKNREATNKALPDQIAPPDAKKYENTQSFRDLVALMGDPSAEKNNTLIKANTDFMNLIIESAEKFVTIVRSLQPKSQKDLDTVNTDLKKAIEDNISIHDEANDLAKQVKDEKKPTKPEKTEKIEVKPEEKKTEERKIAQTEHNIMIGHNTSPNATPYQVVPSPTTVKPTTTAASSSAPTAPKTEKSNNDNHYVDVNVKPQKQETSASDVNVAYTVIDTTKNLSNDNTQVTPTFDKKAVEESGYTVPTPAISSTPNTMEIPKKQEPVVDLKNLKINELDNKTEETKQDDNDASLEFLYELPETPQSSASNMKTEAKNLSSQGFFSDGKTTTRLQKNLENNKKFTFDLITYTWKKETNERHEYNFAMHGNGLDPSEPTRLANLCELVHRAKINDVFKNSIDLQGTLEEVQDTLNIIYHDEKLRALPINIIVMTDKEKITYPPLNFQKYDNWNNLKIKHPRVSLTRETGETIQKAILATDFGNKYKEAAINQPQTIFAPK